MTLRSALTLSVGVCKAPTPAENDVSTNKPSAPDFEQALAELEAVVERLEHGELPLEEAVTQFERGIALARSCQDALKQAEQKVEILLARSAQAEAVPFEPDDPEA
jgi:exodeoxyribonuclease VII small subunit